MIPNPTAFPAAARKALANTELQGALIKLKTGFQVRRAEALARLDNWQEMREAGKALRDYSLAKLDTLLLRFEQSVTHNGGHVHWARDGAEARAIIARLLRDAGAKTVTKSKSMASEEIELNEHLEAEGFTPIETDLGEYIIQLRGEKPSHIIAPAFHLNRRQIAENFRGAHALDPKRDLSIGASLVAEARAVLRQKFHEADAGITGANFMVADTGSVFIVTNEGNADLTRLLPKTHIVLATIDKMVERFEDASFLQRLLTRSATGQDISAYLSIVSGPKRPGETDGPENFHVVLLDNGRSQILNTPVREVLRCIRCAACINHCPIYGAVGGHAYSAVFPGPIGAALNPAMHGLGAAHHLPEASSFCGRCDEVCPVKIPLTRLMRHWRTLSFAKGYNPTIHFGLKLWAMTAKHPALYRVAQACSAFAMRAFSRDGRIRHLPLLSGWFGHRDLAAPAAHSFQDQWRRKT